MEAMSEFSDFGHEEFDPREREEERAEMEKFASVIIGPQWRDEISRRDLVDFWIWHGGEGWRNNSDFVRDWYKEQKRIAEEHSGGDIPEHELRVLGSCIEPTEELYASYKKFDEQACRDINRKNFECGLPADRKVFSYEEFIAAIEDWKRYDPAELYRKVQMWDMDYGEFVAHIEAEVEESCNRVIAFFAKRKKT